MSRGVLPLEHGAVRPGRRHLVFLGVANFQAPPGVWLASVSLEVGGSHSYGPAVVSPNALRLNSAERCSKRRQLLQPPPLDEALRLWSSGYGTAIEAVGTLYPLTLRYAGWPPKSAVAYLAVMVIDSPGHSET